MLIHRPARVKATFGKNRSLSETRTSFGYNDKNTVFETFLDFYGYDYGCLRKVTKSVMPVAFNKLLNYELPWHGTRINVTNKSGGKLYEFVWDKSAFS
jgi:hypothetical protein